MTESLLRYYCFLLLNNRYGEIQSAKQRNYFQAPHTVRQSVSVSHEIKRSLHLLKVLTHR